MGAIVVLSDRDRFTGHRNAVTREIGKEFVQSDDLITLRMNGGSQEITPQILKASLETMPYRRPTMGTLLSAESRARIEAFDYKGNRLLLRQNAGAPAVDNLEDLPTNRFNGSSLPPEGGALGSHDYAYTDFFLTRVDAERVEKTQIAETFGPSYVYFFGSHPIVLHCQGFLLNSPDFPWIHEFRENYEQVLKGTKLIRARARAYLSWDLFVYEGYMMGLADTMDSAKGPEIPFSFSFFVTNEVAVASSVMDTMSELNYYEGDETLTGIGVEDAATSAGIQALSDPFVKVNTALREGKGKEPGWLEKVFGGAVHGALGQALSPGNIMDVATGRKSAKSFGTSIGMGAAKGAAGSAAVDLPGVGRVSGLRVWNEVDKAKNAYKTKGGKGLGSYFIDTGNQTLQSFGLGRQGIASLAEGYITGKGDKPRGADMNIDSYNAKRPKR